LKDNRLVIQESSRWSRSQDMGMVEQKSGIPQRRTLRMDEAEKKYVEPDH
jgi:hypothetical protein